MDTDAAVDETGCVQKELKGGAASVPSPALARLDPLKHCMANVCPCLILAGHNWPSVVFSYWLQFPSTGLARPQIHFGRKC